MAKAGCPLAAVGTRRRPPQVFQASLRAAQLARAAGGKVVFDIDYRPVLWGLTALDLGEDRFVADAAVTARLRQIAGLCDLIVGTEEEFQILGMVKRGFITGPGGTKWGSTGIIVNCPIVHRFL